MEKQCVCLEVGTEFDWNRAWSTRRDQPLCPDRQTDGQTLCMQSSLTAQSIYNKPTAGTGCRSSVAAGRLAVAAVTTCAIYSFVYKKKSSFIPKPHERQMSQMIRIEPRCRKRGFIASNDRFITVEFTRARIRISAKQNVIFLLFLQSLETNAWKATPFK